MILDRLSSARRYAALHPGFEPAFEYLNSGQVQRLPPGKHAIDGERLHVMLSDQPGRGREAARLEAHRKYIDIQYVLSGADLFGWRPLADCQSVDLPYDAQRDVAFWTDRADVWVPLTAGTFVVFYPEDAHAPMAGNDAMVKAVVKVAVEW
jgi:YhcH/YjgK/YiaL family protein